MNKFKGDSRNKFKVYVEVSDPGTRDRVYISCKVRSMWKIE